MCANCERWLDDLPRRFERLRAERDAAQARADVLAAENAALRKQLEEEAALAADRQSCERVWAGLGLLEDGR